MKKVLFFIFGCLFAFVLTACPGPGGSSTKKVKYPNAVQTEWRASFEATERLFEAKKYNEAEAGYKAYVQSYPYNALTDKSEFRLGQIEMVRTRLDQATAIYETLRKKTPDPMIRSKSSVKIGLIAHAQKRHEEAYQGFFAADATDLDDYEKVKAASLGVRSAEIQKKNLNDRAYFYSTLLDTYETLSSAEIRSKFGTDALSKEEVQAKFKAWIDETTPPSAIDPRLVKQRGRYNAALLDFKLGKSYHEAGESKQASKYLKKAIAASLAPEYSAKAQAWLSQSGEKADLNQRRGNGKAFDVGVVLPLSGKFEAYGQKVLRGMQCGASEKLECRHGATNIRLIVKDSASDPLRAGLAVDELVQKDHVMAILGPLPSNEVEAVVRKAEENGVALISVSPKKDTTTLGNSVFRIGLLPAEQVSLLVTHLTQRENAKVFGVFYPNNPYGQEFLAEFEKAVSTAGAKINAKQAFPANQEDLSNEARQLKLSVTEMEAGGKIFDALFIPDSYLGLGRATKALSAADVSQTILVGTNAWNDTSLPSKIGSGFTKGIFTDLYSKDSASAPTKNFVQDFQAAFQYAPASLEAIGYDTVLVLSEALSSTKSPKRSEIKDLLMGIHQFQGATGFIGFKDSHEAHVRPILLEVNGGKITEIAPAGY